MRAVSEANREKRDPNSEGSKIPLAAGAIRSGARIADGERAKPASGAERRRRSEDHGSSERSEP
jgi:hypothetical protein